MPEELIEVVSPQLSAPVTRKPVDTVAISQDGVSRSMVEFPVDGQTIPFAADDDE
ncbi:hypothetical protein [Saccharopolyspora sp. NPDC002376]